VDGLGKRLPRGWHDFLRQLAIWLGFVVAYQVARGLADRGADEALRNAERVVELERRIGGLVELDVQRFAFDTGDALVQAANWTYWLSQFALVSAALLWVYLRRNSAYLPLRNTLIVANTIGLVVYVALPTAPPRLLPHYGFLDTLAGSQALNHGSGLVELAANRYAAMPSLHAADALIVGVGLALVVGRPSVRIPCLLFPLWVWFSLLATANHFWLDVAAGVLIAILGALGAAFLTRSRQRVPTTTATAVLAGSSGRSLRDAGRR
jgi:membrane-associated phospholipid phosphatase